MPRTLVRRVQRHAHVRSLFGPVFVLAGVNHFVNPRFYLRIMPPWLPAHEAMNVGERRRGDRRRRRRRLPGPARAAPGRLVLDRDARRGLPRQLAHGAPSGGVPRGPRRRDDAATRGCRCRPSSSPGRSPRCGRRRATDAALSPRRAGARRASASRPAGRSARRRPGARLAAKRANRCGGSVSGHRPHAVQRDRVERAPVDRHREPRAQQRGRLGRAARVHVAGAERRPPPPHREQRDVERRVARQVAPSRRRRRCRPRSRRGSGPRRRSRSGRRADRRTGGGDRRGRPAPRARARRSSSTVSPTTTSRTSVNPAEAASFPAPRGTTIGVQRSSSFSDGVSQ